MLRIINELICQISKLGMSFKEINNICENIWMGENTNWNFKYGYLFVKGVITDS